MKNSPRGLKTSILKERDVPVVIISKKADVWIKVMVDEHEAEVGFLGIVDEIQHNGKPAYYVREIFYPKHQRMDAGTCEISAEGETEIANFIMDRCESDVEKIRFWGHSHHTMGTSPSGQDEKQAIERMEGTQKYLIRAICNKSGEMSISFFDYETMLKHEDLPFIVECDEYEQKVREKVRDLKIANKPVPPPLPFNNVRHNSHNGYNRNYYENGGLHTPPSQTSLFGIPPITPLLPNKNNNECVEEWMTDCHRMQMEGAWGH
jgi:hypothetical protein